MVRPIAAWSLVSNSLLLCDTGIRTVSYCPKGEGSLLTHLLMFLILHLAKALEHRVNEPI